jgi:hypothetical protein
VERWDPPALLAAACPLGASAFFAAIIPAPLALQPSNQLKRCPPSSGVDPPIACVTPRILRITGEIDILVAMTLISCARKTGLIVAGPTFEKDLQTDLIQAKPGAVIELPEGRFNMTRTLSLTVPNVTIRGKRMGKTVLTFQTSPSWCTAWRRWSRTS